MKLLLILTLLISSQIFAADCEPALSIETNTPVVKEGHKSDVKEVVVKFEMDRTCEVDVSFKAILKGITAVVGVDVTGPDVTQVTIASGQTKSFLTYWVEGNDDWNEDRIFEVRAINPSHGYFPITAIDVAIENDDPLIKLIYPNSVSEPSQVTGVKYIPFKVELSMPTDRWVSAIVQFADESAIRGSDYKGVFSIGFDIRPGETTFDFTDKILGILADKEKEDAELIRINLLDVVGGSMAEDDYFLTITDPASTRYRVAFNSSLVVRGSEGPVQTMKYSALMEGEKSETGFTSLPVTPKYSFVMSGPFQIQAFPGQVTLTNIEVSGDQVISADLFFAPAPWEVMPFNGQKTYLFMSLFGHFHSPDLIPNNDPQFRLKGLQSQGSGRWSAEYRNQLAQDGGKVVETTTLLVEEIE